jgi:putative NIF3 family GTP cyclohydrolase 1 type 2
MGEASVKAKDVHEHLLSLNGGWVDPASTVDRVIAGDPGAPVRGIAVGWMSYYWALEEAVKLGCNLFVTHEPTYYNHLDNEVPAYFQHERVQEKQRFIEEHGLVILRCHDVWDQLPGLGIPDAWAGFLGLTDPIDGEGYYRLFDGQGKPARQVARDVARKTARLGQDVVQLIGPADKPVHRLCIGTGAMTPFNTYLEEYQADMGICTDDGMFHCFEGALAIDLGIPLLVVNHAVSEEPGIASLAAYLAWRYADIPVHHIPQGASYKNVASQQ